MPFDVEMPDGTIIEDVPDGTTKEQVLAKYNAMMGVKAPKTVPDVRTEGFASNEGGAAFGIPRQMGGRRAVVQPVTPLEASGQGLVKGLIAPALAVTELVGGETGRQYVKDIKKQKEAARAEAGLEGFDVSEFVGNVINPINRLIPLGTAVTTGGRVAQATGAGAVIAALNPTDGEDDYVSAKLKQIGLGAFLGLGMAGGVEVGGKLLDVAKEAMKPFTDAGRRQILVDYFNRLTGGKGEEVIASLRNAKELVPGSKPTAAEAISDIPEATALAAYQAQVAKTPSVSGQWAAREAQQVAARRAAVQEVGGTADDLLAAKLAREADASRNYGQAFAEVVIADPKLAQIASNPYIRDAIPDAVKLAEAKGISAKTDLTEFLQYVKVSLDKQLAKTGDTALSRTEKGVVAKAKGDLLNWLSAKNPKFEEARASFAEASKPINQMEIGQYLEQKLGAPLADAERAGAFATAMRDVVGTIKKASGAEVGKELSDVLTPKQVAALESVLADLNRKAAAGNLSRQTSIGTDGANIGAEVPRILNRTATITNSLLTAVKQDAREKINTLASELLLDPKKLADFMSSIPKGRVKLIVESLLGKLNPEIREAFIKATDVSKFISPSQGIVRTVTGAEPEIPETVPNENDGLFTGTPAIQMNGGGAGQ